MPEEPKHVGCPYCVRGHAPTWSWETSEWKHMIQVRSADGNSTEVTVVACTANQQSSHG
jgi:hypothetical protein